jgi:fucose permease
MKANMGTADKVVRILAAIAIVGLYLANLISGTIAIILLIFAGIFIATSFMSFCPLYLPFGISTRKKSEEANR